MTKQILKLGFTDTIEPVKDFFIEVLSKDYDVVRDDDNPDYLIFGDRNFGEQNKVFNNRNVVKIFYTGENQRAWDYDCHYAIRLITWITKDIIDFLCTLSMIGITDVKG